ncbi:MAG: LamG-like jellyroll fold domain-containing protein, partial [Verrucomicrobiota bacterium]
PNPDGPEAHYRLDETDGAAGATDATGNGNLAEFVSEGSSVLGGAGLAEGLNTSLTVNGGGALRFASGFDLDGFTVSAWFTASSLGDAGAADFRTIFAQGETNPEFGILEGNGNLFWFGSADGEPTILFNTEDSPVAVGETYHIAVIYDNDAGTGTILLNGAEVASGDVSDVTSEGAFFAGAFNGGIFGFDGSIDDVQFYGRPLTVDTDIPFLMENPGSVLNPFDLGVDPDSDQDGLSDKDEIGIHGTDPLKADTDDDGLSDGAELEASLDPLNPDTDGDGIKDGNDAEPLVPADPGDFLVVHYDFNEGSGTVIGNKGSGGDGELVNAHDAAWVESGSADGSGYLNFQQGHETPQHVATGLGLDEVQILEGPYTMTAWVRAETTSPGGNSEDNVIFGQLEGAEPLHNGLRGGSFHVGHWGNDYTAGTVTVGEWQHVAYRYDDAGLIDIFVDGEKQGAGSVKGGVDGAEGEIVIGSTKGDQDRDFSGDLDEIRIYNFALSDSAIASIAAGESGGGGSVDGLLGYWRFDEGEGAVAGDSSGNGTDGTIVEADTAWANDPGEG